MYIVFSVTKLDELLPEYLNLWFSREEFCRYVAFYAFGSVRDTFDYGLMEQVILPIPNIETQSAIVTIYNAYLSRQSLSDKLKNLIAPLCPVLTKGYANQNLANQA
jgi:type I restriction enzyme S subunit